MEKKLKFLLFFAAALLLLFAAPVALAHANLVRSEPAAGSAQKTSPDIVRMWFSEDIEPSFSSASVVDKNSQRVDKGDSHRMSGDPKGMEVSLKPNLPPGLYTVIWKTTSAVDGHVVAGSFPFTVGNVPLAEASPHEIMSQVDTALSNSAAPPLYQVVVRWLNILLLSLLAGSFTFPLLVLFPALRAAKSAKPLVRVYADYFKSANVNVEADAALAAWTRRWRRYTQIVFALYALTTLATLFAQAYTVGNILTAVIPILTSTRFGAVWLFRAAILVALGVVLFRARWRMTADARASRALLLALALGFLLALTQSLDSHGAAVSDPPVLPLLVDLIHLFGVVIWVGGLVQLIATLPALLSALPASSKMQTLAAVISAFSLVAFLTVGIVILSGAYSLIVQVGSLEAFFATLYGETLFVKFLLILPLLALAAVNLIINRNAYARASAERAVPFIHRIDFIVALEAVLAAAVLLVVGFLTSVAPAKGAYDPSSKLWIETHSVDGLNVTLGVLPAQVGTNDFDVKVQDASGQPVTNATVVRLYSSMVEMDMGIQENAATSQGNGHYTFHGDLLSMVGTWHVEILVRRPGYDDARTTFSIFTQSQPAAQFTLSPVVNDPTAQAGLGLTLAGFAIATATVLLLGQRRERWLSLIGAVAISLTGVIVVNQAVASTAPGPVVIVPVVPAFAHLQPDPVRPVPAQIAAGRQVFLQNCATCHGVDGKGDGPAAANLNPKPADLTVHAPLHTEGDLYWWVTHGISGTAMPAWDSTLTDLQRWQVVTFVKNTFGANSTPTPPPAAATAQSIVLVGHPAADFNVTLTISPSSGAMPTFDAEFTDANQQPAAGVQSATLEFTWLDQSGNPTPVNLTAGADGHYRASGNFLSQPGMWLMRVIAQRQSGEVVTAFPFYQAGNQAGSQANDAGALQILQQSDAQMNTLKTLRATQDLTDGNGGSATTQYEYQAPDRLLYQVAGGIESIAVGATQYDLQNGVWSSRARVDPFVFPSFDNVSQANGIRLGRTDTLNGAPMQIVESTLGSGDTATHFAYWIGVTDHLVQQYAMIAPSHFMMQYYLDYNAPLDIPTPTVGEIDLRQQVAGMNVELSVLPRAAGVSDFDVRLTDASGAPVDDASRVMLVTGMTNMTHEANSVRALPAGNGHYRASGPWIYMGGPWQIGLVVQTADKNTRTAAFQFNVPENNGPVISQRIDNSPSSVQQINELVYAGTVVPDQTNVSAQQSVRVTAMLMEPSKTRCGGKMTLPELGQSTPFSGAGIAELEFTAPRAAQLHFDCQSTGFVITLQNPTNPN